MPPFDPPRSDAIRIRGARQNNLKNLDLDLPLNELIVVTGVSGSGKSSLVFDTLYAEGQRRYVETFSPYARQFLDRMDKPLVDRIEGIPPAIAIDQTNPVRTSRSTVGTMTELNDHLKLLFARAAVLHCQGCGRPVRRDTPASIQDSLASLSRDNGDPPLLLTFPVPIPKNFTEAEIKGLLSGQGYTRIHEKRGDTLQVIQDRFRWSSVDPARAGDAIEAALKVGQGRIDVYPQEAGTGTGTAGGAGRIDGKAGAATFAAPWRFSTGLHCPDCDINYKDPSPSSFSFNSPVGACDTCRGFGRSIGVDYGLVIPDTTLSLRQGAIKPWQTESYAECQADLLKFARKRAIPVDTPWRDLTDAERAWVIEGEGEWTKNVWYGVRRFFAWLETKAYKMHIRVLLSRYRSYTECGACQGARLKPDALLWRVGNPGINIRELMLMPIDDSRRFFASLALPAPLDEAADLLLREIRARLKYLSDVGLGYLNLDRQSRTLSGGEVQRINLTTALGTSLVNTLFVLDEPSIGLHPRDVGRIVGVMHRLRDAGNTLVVVEHDPKVIQAADRVLDIGPGPGEHGGEVVFFGPIAELAGAKGSLTADYLFRRRRVEAPRDVRTRVRQNGAPGTDAAGADTLAAGVLQLTGAAEHNLKAIDVAIPLRRLVCVTGVSGSGKSTLVHDILFPALQRAKGKPTENPGRHRALEGAELIDGVIMVDQNRIGRTTRSNPASYVGAFDAIRDLFARLPQARERKYTAGTFSFNAGNGRCPGCGGNGFEHVEMQFLSDVYLRCPDCDGRRYRAEVLEVKLSRGDAPPKSIADVLDLTVSEALAFFAADTEVCLVLAPLADVGLDYLRLGQPVPTLSGGEAQRLKLAGHLAENAVRLNSAKRASQKKAARGAVDAAPRKGSLFLFDEPTTGLHFDDVAKLLRAFRRLIDAGHSLLVIEHNLDVVRAADWIIDLGPEGGEAGGQVVCVGAPSEVMRVPASHTGQALAEAENPLPFDFGGGVRDAGGPAYGSTAAVYDAKTSVRRSSPPTSIEIHGAREHNLKNVDVNLKLNQFTVITGVSGSGKSTLAFDILFAEGQRRYLESLNAYARQFVQPASRPDVDAIFGIPPTVAIEQRTSRGGHKSTVATLTEIYHFLRLLYVKLGVQYCPVCEARIEPQSVDAIAARLLKDYRGESITLLAPLIVARKGLYTALAKWARGKGFSHLRVDGALLPTVKWPRLDRFIEHNIELPVATLTVSAAREGELRQALDLALEHGRGVVHVDTAAGAPKSSKAAASGAVKASGSPGAAGADAATVSVFSTKRACPNCGTGFPELDPRLFSFNSKHGWCKSCFGTGLQLEQFDAEQSGEESAWRDAGAAETEDAQPVTCSDCAGQRLNPVALHVLFRNQSIAALTDLPVQDFSAALQKLKLIGRERDIARDLLVELAARTAFLCDVGLGYLQLNRAAPTLSGGEAQRIRLAAQLGSNLQGVCYVLDEPTIGLHPRDNVALLATLDRLRAKGNTLVVVEHDEDTIRRADHVIDLGPGAGTRGGRVVAQGTATQLARLSDSATGRCLAAPLQHSRSRRRSIERDTPMIDISGATLHNLRKVDARIPLGRLTVVTGVSGSGKSSLARDVLLRNLKRLLARPQRSDRTRKSDVVLEGCDALEGWQKVSRVLEVDQTPIGKTPRSCPATYIGFWDSIRRLYADTTEARMRGFTASRFSFNTAGGRCEACEGQGMQRIEMSFLPDVQVLCDVCGGKRFNPETLAILFKGKSIGETLAMSVDDALEFFAAQRSVHHPVSLLADVGLGYLSLGQPSPTLSGGESQRIKLVTELSKVRTDALGIDTARREGQHTLYVLDEPTVGLHMADVEKLVRVLHRLVDTGNTVVVIEHNLDVMAEADWIIDLGPEGGDGGGRIVAQGSPEAIARKPNKSHTAKILGEFLAERGVA
jgi:excinuclease ABC subunit A